MALSSLTLLDWAPRRGIFVGVREGDRLGPKAAQSLVMQAFLPPQRTPDPELAQVRRQGYAAVTYEENGVTAVARPVFQEDAIVATVAVVGTARTVDGTTVGKVADRLGRAAGDIGTELGSRRPSWGEVVPG